MKRYLLALFLSCLAWTSTNKNYSELFAKYLTELDYPSCFQILDDWEAYGSLDEMQKASLQACVIMAEGNFLEGRELLSHLLLMFSPHLISNELQQKLISMLNNNTFIGTIQHSTHSNYLSLCKRTQPKGVCFRYWFRVSQVVAGCIVMPFNPAAGSTLIASGVSTVAHAAADCMDNKEKMEREREEIEKKYPRDAYD